MVFIHPFRRILPSLLVLFATLLLPGANSSAFGKQKGITQTVTDMAGRTMQLPAEIKRVYVNRPGSILMYAIEPEMIVNRSFQYTPEAQHFFRKDYLALPFVENSPEEIMKLAPDLILNFYDINAQTIDQSERLSAKTGIPVYIASLHLKDYPEVFRRLGKVFGREEQTQKMLAFIQRHVDPVAAKSASIPAEKRLSVYYAEGERGLHTDPSGSIHTKLIEMVGATNAAAIGKSSRKGLSAVSMEQLYLWNPDRIIVWAGLGKKTGTMAHIKSDPVWGKLPAVRNGNIHQIPYLPFGWFDRPASINRLLGVPWLANLLYPDHYRIDIKAVVSEYYETFYHYQLSDAELEQLLGLWDAVHFVH